MSYALTKFYKRLLNVLEIFLIILFIIFEKSIWFITQPIVKYLRSLGVLQKLREKLDKIDRLYIMLIFCSFFGISEYLGLLSLKLIATAELKLGILIYALKIPLGVFSFWFLEVQKEKLISYAWFNKIYSLICYLLEKLKTTKPYKIVEQKSQKIKNFFKNYKIEFHKLISYIKNKFITTTTNINKNKYTYFQKIKSKYNNLKKKYF